MSDPVFVYRNLRKNCWSIRATRGPSRGRVIAHRDEVHLRDCEFKVSEAGRQRVLRERRKNVHAGVQGLLAEPRGGRRVLVSYNPYEHGYFFVISQTGQRLPVFSAEGVTLHPDGKATVRKENL